MRVFADRFLLDDTDVVDLATGESVRLWVDDHPPKVPMFERYHACDVHFVIRCSSRSSTTV